MQAATIEDGRHALESAREIVGRAAGKADEAAGKAARATGMAYAAGFVVDSVMAGMTGDTTQMKRNAERYARAGFLENFEGLGWVIMSISIGLATAGLVLNEFGQKVDDNGTAQTVIDKGQDLLVDTIDLAGIGLFVFFGVLVVVYFSRKR